MGSATVGHTGRVQHERCGCSGDHELGNSSTQLTRFLVSDPVITLDLSVLRYKCRFHRRSLKI